MQKVFNKVIAIVLTFMMVGVNFIATSVYAANEIIQDSTTTEANVQFDAKLGDSYNTTATLEDGAKLNLTLKVLNTGYLKNPKVTINGNNYEVTDITDKNVKSVSGNVIELNQVNAGETINISLPIKLNKSESLATDAFSRDSTITLNATYVNAKGAEKSITKSLTEHLEWKADATYSISQKLIRYIKYASNKTMLSIEVSDGINENKVPTLNKEISVKAPTLNDNQASKVIVTGDNISYTYENGIVTIKQENKKDANGNISWNSNSTYMITYLYDAVVNDADINSTVSGKATLITNNILESKANDITTKVKDEIGSIVEGNIVADSEIGKGYMYTNLKNTDNKLETNFSTNYILNIGYADLTDSIKVTEQATTFNSDSNKYDVSNSITDKKVSISSSQITNILGNDGTIKVSNIDGTLIGTLTKDAPELEVNSNKLIFETSKTIAEGNISINVSKVINSSLKLKKEEIQSIKTLNTGIQVESIKDNKTISTENINQESKLTEPQSNAKIEINTTNLSTVVENKGVVITATLDTNEINDALYENPNLTITLPAEVKNINLTDAKLLYEDELVPTNFSSTGNVIKINLQGIQTKYNTQSVSTGTVIRIVTDLTLDNLAPSKNGITTLTYSNDATNETKTVSTNVGIVAQTGFVTTNELTVDGTTTIAQENNENIAKVKANSSEKDMKISGTIVNNLGADASGFTILGRIPFSGNKNAEGTDIGSNVDTTISSAVTTTGINAVVYYSSNKEETIDGSSWTTTYSSNAKSYKIVANENIANATTIKFNYNVKLPANLAYENTTKATYAIYYNNNSQDGTKQNIVVAKSVGVTTGEVPAITENIKVTNASTGEEITNGGDVTEGEYISYKVTVKNTGKEDGTNVKVTANLPIGMSSVKYTDSDSGAGNYSVSSKDNETITKTIGTVKANSEETVEFIVAVTQVISEINTGITADQLAEKEKLTSSFVTEADKIEAVSSDFTVKNNEGYLHVDLSSDVSSSSNKVSKDQEVTYKVAIKNVNAKVKNGLTIQLHLPSGVEYNGEKYSSSYDKKTNTVTATLDSIEGYSRYSALFDTKVTTNDSTNLSAYVTVTTDNNTETKSNILILSQKNDDTSSIKATQSSNISDGTLLDTDDLEFYIDITNNTQSDASLIFKDTLPAGLTVKSYKLVADGKEIQSSNGGYISTAFTLAQGKTARATIAVKVISIDINQTETFENAPVLATANGTNISLNTLKVTVKGTGATANTDDSSNTATQSGTYKITGSVWFDNNYDGKKDIEETKISGLKVTVYNKSTGTTAKDSTGKDLVTTTDGDGKYAFTNVNKGSYYVVVEYDTNKYDITTYKAKDLSESENSDFIASKIGDNLVAATDTIDITNSNIYNIDLGLTNKKEFDLKLDQVVSKITVTNTKAKTHVYTYNKSIAKVELSNTYVEYATVLVEYTIRITNEGQIAGYAKSIVDYLAEGMTFNSELNNNWYIGEDGNGYNTSLSNTIINPGETKEITLVLSKKMTDNNMGTARNTAEIKSDYNEYGLKDRNSTPGNKKDGEDDMASADAVILVGTGKESASVAGIAVGLLAVIALAVYEIKKHVINKMYRNIL